MVPAQGGDRAARSLILGLQGPFASARQETGAAPGRPVAGATRGAGNLFASSAGSLGATPTLAPLRVVVFAAGGGAADDSGEAAPASSPTLLAADPAAVAAAAALLDRSGHQVARAGGESASSLLARLAALYAVAAVTERQAVEDRVGIAPVLAGAAYASRAAGLPGGGGAPAAPLGNPAGTAEPGPRRQDRTPGHEGIVPPEPRATGSRVAAGAPQTAGLLTDVVFSGLATLEQAIRNLIEPEPKADQPGAGLACWLGLSCWLLAGALALEVARRRRGLPAPDLVGGPNPGEGPP